MGTTLCRSGHEHLNKKERGSRSIQAHTLMLKSLETKTPVTRESTAKKMGGDQAMGIPERRSCCFAFKNGNRNVMGFHSLWVWGFGTSNGVLHLH